MASRDINSVSFAADAPLSRHQIQICEPFHTTEVALHKVVEFFDPRDSERQK
jgi:hypothetical protein